MFNSEDTGSVELLYYLTDVVIGYIEDEVKPDSLVANRYMSGNDCVPFHADDAALSGARQTIIIMSWPLGASHRFEWKLKAQTKHTHTGTRRNHGLHWGPTGNEGMDAKVVRPRTSKTTRTDSHN